MGRGPEPHHLRPEHDHTVIPILSLVIQCDLNRHSLRMFGDARIMPAQDGARSWSSGGALCFLDRKFNTLHKMRYSVRRTFGAGALRFRGGLPRFPTCAIFETE